ncbi:MAG TPA: tRNA lysidine(34) synthetase TilS [Gammaproteobacteria bacterium]|nr:tRNA lysidine(34) synthetase TilS [Gammaproteobacteria bacterium]
MCKDPHGKAAAPIGDEELAGLFHDLKSYFPLTLAVSGGVDSMCLMHLVSRWIERQMHNADRQVQVVTVDHALRSGSTAEARLVARQAAALGLPHKILVWEGDKPATGLQQAARHARYGLIREYLAGQARKTGGGDMPALVSAHHLDDQAETVLMRLARGSGADGLGAMGRKVHAHGLVILRPLLEVPKARLLATARERDIAFMEDPSNANRDFERVRLREARNVLDELGLSSRALALSARRLARAARAIELAVDDLIARSDLKVHDCGYVSLQFAPFLHASEELRIRLMARVLRAMNGGTGRSGAPVNLEKLEDLVTALDSPDFSGATLQRCQILVGRQERLVVLRESGRDGLEARLLQPADSIIWDDRFCLSLSDHFDHALEVKALSGADWIELKRKYRDLEEAGISQRLAVTLPALWQEDRLLAVPALAAIVPNLAGPQVHGRPVINIKVSLLDDLPALSGSVK